MSNPFKAMQEIYEEGVSKEDAKGYSDLFKKGAELFFNETKFTPIDIEYLDGYFIFGTGTNSIVHFHVKECKNWIFAIWWDVDPERHILKGEFFGQYEPTLDKFKPSRSSFVNEIQISLTEDNKEFEDEDYYVIPDRIDLAFNFIKKHPLKAWAHDYCRYDEIYRPMSSWEIIKSYIGYKIYDFKSEKILSIFDRNMANLSLKLGREMLNQEMEEDEYELKLHDSGKNTSPRYDLQCKVPEDYEYEGMYGLFGDSEFEQEAKKMWKKREKFFKFLANKILRISWYNEASDDIVFWKASHWDEEGNWIGPEEEEENDQRSKENSESAE